MKRKRVKMLRVQQGNAEDKIQRYIDNLIQTEDADIDRVRKVGEHNYCWVMAIHYTVRK